MQHEFTITAWLSTISQPSCTSPRGLDGRRCKEVAITGVNVWLTGAPKRARAKRARAKRARAIRAGGDITTMLAEGDPHDPPPRGHGRSLAGGSLASAFRPQAGGPGEPPKTHALPRPVSTLPCCHAKWSVDAVATCTHAHTPELFPKPARERGHVDKSRSVVRARRCISNTPRYFIVGCLYT
jgi:hypothetical protein